MKKCEVCGSNRRVFNNKSSGMILCDNHRAEFRKHGKILTRRKITDPNKIVVIGDYAELYLYNIIGEITQVAKIPVDKIDIIKQHKWSYHSAGYVSTNIGSEILLLHRLIIECPEDMEVDHINRDRLDFRNGNLRICKPYQNSINKNIRSDNTTGVIGVNWDKTRNKYQARLEYNNSRKLHKRTDSFDEAVKVRIIAESKYFKEFSPNYNPDTNTIQLEYYSHDDNKQTFIEISMKGEILNFNKLEYWKEEKQPEECAT